MIEYRLIVFKFRKGDCVYCKNCGVEVINNDAYVCLSCGALINASQQQKPKFYSAGFVLGILSLCIPFYGFILGVIGLPLACISKRKSSIIMNCIGIVLAIAVYVLIITATFYFAGEVIREIPLDIDIDIITSL